MTRTHTTRLALVAAGLLGAGLFNGTTATADFDIGGENYVYDCRHNGSRFAWASSPSECYQIHGQLPPHSAHSSAMWADEECPPGKLCHHHAGCVITIIEDI